jgi:hypothetical protein
MSTLVKIELLPDFGFGITDVEVTSDTIIVPISKCLGRKLCLL